MGIDLLLNNATFLTMDEDNPVAAAVGIERNRIVWVGGAQEASELINVGREIDLGGATVVPGFNDAHNHLILLGYWMTQLDCSYPAVESIADIVAAVGERVTGSEEGVWIEGRGYDDNKLLERRNLTRWDLDSVSPNNPVIIKNASGHMCIVNTRALDMSGITRHTDVPFGGTVDLDRETGEPTGLLQEQAQNLLNHISIPADKGTLHRCLQTAGAAYLSAGVTSCQEAGIFSTAEFTVFQEAWASGTLPLRVYMMLRRPFLESMETMGVFTGFGDERLRIGCFKLLADGSLIGRTAAVSQPFLGDPTSDNLGLAMMSQDELDDLVWRAHSKGWQVGIHAIGDRGIEMCLDAYQCALKRLPRANHRHRLEHCGVLRPDLIRRIKDMDIIPVGQPPFINEFGDGFLLHLGMERAQLTYALKSVLDAGIHLAASSDSPVSSYQPLLGIKTCVTQRTASGAAFAPGERISVEQAIALYTRAGAYASFEEDIKGTISTGKLADFAVLGADPRTVEPETLDQISVLATVRGGEMVYEAPIAS